MSTISMGQVEPALSIMATVATSSQFEHRTLTLSSGISHYNSLKRHFAHKCFILYFYYWSCSELSSRWGGSFVYTTSKLDLEKSLMFPVNCFSLKFHISSKCTKNILRSPEELSLLSLIFFISLEQILW